MIRVMVVDDEPMASKRIARLVEKIDPNFRVVAQAQDGEEALEILESTPCDLIFTDIRMPVMNGVEFMQRLRAENSECMIVVVSGHSDFGYVSSALRMSATDYLLKPIAEEDMRKLLERIHAEYLRRTNESLRRELASRINKAVPQPRAANSAETERDLGVFLFCAGSMPVCENVDLCPGTEFWGRIHFKSILERCLGEHAQFSWEFMGTTAAERIVIIRSPIDDMRIPAELLYNEILEQADLPVTCVCDISPVSLREVEGALKRMRTLLSEQLRIGQSRLIVASACPTRAEEAAQFEQLLPEAMDIILHAGAEHKPLFAKLEAEDWSQDEIFGLFLVALNRACAERSLNYREALQLRNALEESFSSALSLTELQSDLSGLCVSTEEGEAQSAKGGIAVKIAEYLDRNYADHITNQMLAGLFGYVPSYLSILFRKEYNMSPVEYLTEVRIRQAKLLMEQSPDILIKDVAESVGFKSQHHFSHTFKKYEGVWPTSYKSKSI